MAVVIRRIDQLLHKQLTNTAALQIWHDRDRSHKCHDSVHPVFTLKRDRPALQSAHQRSVAVQRGKAEQFNRTAARTHFIGRARLTICAKSGIQQSFNSIFADLA